LCGLQKLIIGESPYPGNTYYEPLTLTLKELKRDFKNYLKVVSNSNNSIDELDEPKELVVAFVPRLLKRKDLDKLVSFRRVVCMIYGQVKAKKYIRELNKEIKGIKSRGKKKKEDLENISKKIAKKLHDDGIVLLNVLKAAPDKEKGKKRNIYFKSICDYCNKHEEARVLILGRIAVDACNKKIKKRRRNVLKYYHPSGRVNNEEKWKGIDYNNKAKLNTIEEVKGFSKPLDYLNQNS
jgi:uracil DNA glycosylase superfamily